MDEQKQTLFDVVDVEPSTIKETVVEISVIQEEGPREISASEPSFEESMQRLELLVRQLERGELSLEQSLTCFEEGIGLVKRCQKQLDRTAQQIQILTAASSN